VRGRAGCCAPAAALPLISDVRALKRPTRRTAALAGAAVLGVSGALVLGIGLSAGEPAVPATADGPRPTAESTDPPPAESTELGAESTPAVLPPPSSSVHIGIDAVGVDLPVLPVTPRNGVINPPLLTAAYFIDSYGHPVGSPEEADNTLYIAAHSAGSGRNGFDPLLGSGQRDSALEAGDVIDVRTAEGTVSYTVERTQRYDKKSLEDAADVWEASPGRLVLITCFQRGGPTTTENLVVFAES